MFCEHCGTKIEEGAQFCQSCGRKAGASSKVSVKESSEAPEKIENGAVYYGEDWRRKKVFAVVSLPYYDVMVDKDYLYIISMPKYGGAATGFFIGLILFNIIGAAIGSSMGSSKDAKKRKWYRTAWVNAEHDLTSRDYVNDIFLKIPLKNLKEHITVEKKRFTVESGDKKITLARIAGSFGMNSGKEEFERFTNAIQPYVL